MMKEHDKDALLLDMHAEMLAIRGFRRFIVQEITKKQS